MEGLRTVPAQRVVLDGHILPTPPHPTPTRPDRRPVAHRRHPRRVPPLPAARRRRLLPGRRARPARLLDAYRTRTGTTELADLRAEFLGDAIYRTPATRLARAQVAAGGRAFHYLLLDEPCGPDLGAFHGVDLLYVFDKLPLAGADTPEHRAVRDRLTAVCRDFTAHGDPGWAPCDGNSRAFGGTSDMVAEPPDRRPAEPTRGIPTAREAAESVSRPSRTPRKAEFRPDRIAPE
ncbi:carboxylesterase family protein [Streptomyces niveiscabiei]|uniref:hypothetical protein n=1 Tax=Streptomyces niveiscabiei TaxID=164115 RepID=UPI0029B91CA6|nr:hypothetical protein [Streptomyces niveiscabiei]MDX3385554.1 carboxylesterase family protein [Streptomyces niveiscabiei]